MADSKVLFLKGTITTEVVSVAPIIIKAVVPAGTVTAEVIGSTPIVVETVI